MKKDPKKKKVKIEKQDKVLIATFIGMIALVAILGIIALNLDNIYKDDSKDLTIPILEEHSDSELSVEATTLEAGDIQEYILVVANYKEKELLTDIDARPATEKILAEFEGKYPHNKEKLFKDWGYTVIDSSGYRVKLINKG